MLPVHPLPFKLGVPGDAASISILGWPWDDVIDTEGVPSYDQRNTQWWLDFLTLNRRQSVSYKLTGRLHFEQNQVTFEFAGTRTVEKVSLTKIGTDVSHSPIGTLEVPISWISDVRLTGGWWWPRLIFRSRRLDAFQGIPGSPPGIVAIKIARRDRDHARLLVEAINAASDAAPLRDGPAPPGVEGTTDGHLLTDGQTDGR